MPISAKERRVLGRLRAVRQALQAKASATFLAVEYKKNLFGGWRHPDGRHITKPHTKAIEFHEACKDPQFSVFLIAGGNRSGKSFHALSEFCAWIRGERPWDGSKTAPRGQGRDWLLAGQSFSKAFPLVLNPYFETRMKDYIVERVKDQRKNTVLYYLKTGDRVHCLSYQQWSKADKQSGNPYEGPAWYGAYFDEPPPYDVWIATQRGLVTGTSRGWGKAIIAATILEHPWLLHEIYSEAYNMGGSKEHIYATHFTIYDNPFNTEEAIDQFKSEMSDELAQVRLFGRPRFLSGRVFSEWDPNIHIYDESDFNPLEHSFTDGYTASTPPIIMSVDPHPRRPWAIAWIAVLPDNNYYVVRQWPNGPYHKMKSSNHGFDDYARIIREVEETFPGGSQRVLWREFDPNLSRTPQAMAQGSTTMQKEMAKLGLRFRSDVNDKIYTGHEVLHTLLQYDREEPLSELNKPKLYVEASCSNVIYGFENYSWDEYRETEKGLKITPKEEGKDFIDTIRYCVSRKPKFMAWQGRNQWYEKQRTKRAIRANMRARRYG